MESGRNGVSAFAGKTAKNVLREKEGDQQENLEENGVSGMGSSRRAVRGRTRASRRKESQRPKMGRRLGRCGQGH